MWAKRTGWRVLTRNIFTSGLNPHVKIFPIAREGLRFTAYHTIAKMYKVELSEGNVPQFQLIRHTTIMY